MVVSEPPDTYVHGHHESVLRSHTWRTVENSAAYLIPHLRAGTTVLDVGCGPGTITRDLARRVAPARVVGIDAASAVIDAARDGGDDPEPAPGAVDLGFEVGDVYALEFDDDVFDVVHAHQVLQHLRRPVDALREMRRVTRPGGVVAARDADYAGMFWAPADPRLDHWLDLYHRITETNGVEADAGRHLLRWGGEAGFDRMEVTSSTWTYATPDTRSWWGGLWADRVCSSSYADQALGHGLATTDELDAIADAFRAWAEVPHAVFVVPHCEIIATA